MSGRKRERRWPVPGLQLDEHSQSKASLVPAASLFLTPTTSPRRYDTITPLIDNTQCEEQGKKQAIERGEQTTHALLTCQPAGIGRRRSVPAKMITDSPSADSTLSVVANQNEAPRTEAPRWEVNF